jgi:hypothetical protein
MVEINLGCGHRPVASAINLDRTKHSEYVDVVHDLNDRPWPFEGNYADKIYAMDVLEHLDDFVPALGGVLYLQVPWAQDPTGFRDPTHKWHLMPDSIDYFIPGTWLEKDYGFYSPMRWTKIVFKTKGDNLYWELQKCQD